MHFCTVAVMKLVKLPFAIVLFSKLFTSIIQFSVLLSKSIGMKQAHNIKYRLAICLSQLLRPMHLFFLLSTGTVVNMVITINWFVQHFKCKIVRNPKMTNLWMHSSRLIANGHGYCTRSVPYNFQRRFFSYSMLDALGILRHAQEYFT